MAPTIPVCTSHTPIAKATDAVQNEALLAADQQADVWAPVGLSPCLAAEPKPVDAPAWRPRRTPLATTRASSRLADHRHEAVRGPERPARRRAFVRCAQPDISVRGRAVVAVRFRHGRPAVAPESGQLAPVNAMAKREPRAAKPTRITPGWLASTSATPIPNTAADLVLRLALAGRPTGKRPAGWSWRLLGL